jgi:hypothetical protein
MPLEPGTKIGPYAVVAPIGAGGMGEVYRAHDDRLQRDVALKLMSEGGSGDATRLRRMLKEARAASRLSHPNIVAVYDVGTHDDRMFVVTELLEGESLRATVTRGATPWRQALALAAQIAEGLAVAHEHEIVHRDVKPDNVFLTRDGRIKILDFGVATWREPEEGASMSKAATLSQDGLLIGTVGYMSPEQAKGQPVDARTDLFAFGCLLYELLSAKPAFGGASPVEILVAIQRDAPPPLHDLVPGLPDDVVRVVDRCLDKDPARRFQSARDLLFALSLIPVVGSGSDRTKLANASPPTSSSAPTPTPAPAPAPAPASLRSARVALPVVIALLLGAAGAATATRALTRVPEPPSFRQITFRRGTVYTARFTPDGASIVYSAAWDGAPRELFATVPGTRDSRSLLHVDGDVAFFPSTGDVAVLDRAAAFSSGVLARMSLAGGPAKALLDGVVWADGHPGSATTTLVRTVKGRTQLELPQGHTVAEAAHIVYPRLSPDESRVAFLEQLENDSGNLIVVDRDGKRVVASNGWNSIEGLGWRSNDEIWFTGAKEGRALWVWSIDLTGRTRMLCRAPGRLVLHDLAPDGRVVAERNSFRGTLMVHGGLPGGAADAGAGERDLSWQDYSQLGQLSRDGTQMLFSEEGEGAGTGATAYLRSLDGAPPLRIGDGTALALSPDASRALLRTGPPSTHLELVPVGAGRADPLPAGPLVEMSWAAFLPDGRSVLIVAKEQGKEQRLYRQDLGGGEPRAISPEGVSVRGDALSPDGGSVAGKLGGKPVLFSVDGGAPREVDGLLADRLPIGWTSDAKVLFVRAPGAHPARIERFDLATHELVPWRSLAPPDAAGVLFAGSVRMARDGEVYVYESFSLLSDLYVIENLR